MDVTAPKASVKNFFFQTIIYGVGLIVSKTINFILLPLYTNYFSPAELGIYNLVYSIWAFSMVIYSLGLETSFLKFFIEKDDKNEKAGIYSTTLAGTLATSAFFSILLYVLSYKLSQWLSLSNPEEGVKLIKLLSLVMIFDLLYRFPLLLLRSELRASTFFLVSNLFFVSNLILNIIFIVILKYNVDAILLSYIISSVISLIAGIIVTKDFIRIKFAAGLFKKMIKFGSNFILLGFFLIIIDQSDKFFLKFYFDESVVGIYSTCYRLGSVMLLAIMAFRLSWTPYFLNIAKNSESKKVISSIFTYFIFAGSFLFVTFYLFIDDIVKQEFFGFVIINPRFWGGLKIVPIILLSSFFSGLFLNFSVIPLFKNKTSYLSWISLGGCLLNISLNFILIPRFEMYGAAYATLISYILMFTVLYFISQKFYFISYEWKKIAFMSLLIICICFINYFISKTSEISYSIYIVFNFALLIIYLVLIHIFKIIDFKKLKTLFIKRRADFL